MTLVLLQTTLPELVLNHGFKIGCVLLQAHQLLLVFLHRPGGPALLQGEEALLPAFFMDEGDPHAGERINLLPKALVLISEPLRVLLQDQDLPADELQKHPLGLVALLAEREDLSFEVFDFMIFIIAFHGALLFNIMIFIWVLHVVLHGVLHVVGIKSNAQARASPPLVLHQDLQLPVCLLLRLFGRARRPVRSARA